MNDEVEQQQQEPSAPSPSDIVGAALGGSSISDYLAGDDTPVPEPSVSAPEPSQTRSPGELEDLRKKIEALEANENQLRANWNQEHMSRLQAENFVRRWIC